MTATLEPQVTDALVERLRSIKAVEPIIVTCYLKLDLDARQRQGYLRQLKPRIQEILRDAADRGLGPKAVETLREDLDSILSYLDHPKRLPRTVGVALFVSKSLGLFEVVPLARVHRTRIDIDGEPLLTELLECLETMGRYLAVAIDAGTARFFEVTATTATELAGQALRAHSGGRFHPDRKNAPGVGERDFHQQREEERLRLHALTIQRIVQLQRTNRYQGVALLGPAEHTEALSEALPKTLSGTRLGHHELRPSSATPAQIATAVWEVRLANEESAGTAILGKVEDDLARGLAVNGTRETIRALDRKQVRTLVIAGGQSVAGFRGAKTGRLAVDPEELDGEKALPTPNLADWAIEAALAQGGSVQVIENPELARRIVGLAARLRFVEG